MTDFRDVNLAHHARSLSNAKLEERIKFYADAARVRPSKRAPRVLERRDIFIREFNRRTHGRGGETNWLPLTNLTNLSRTTIERICKES